MWKGGGGNFLGFEICCWGIGFVWWTFCCSCLNCCCYFCSYCHYTPFPLLARMLSSPPTITIATRNNNLFIICCDLCSTLAGTRNNAWCKHYFYVWHLYLGCEYEPKIHRCNINSSIDQDSRNNGIRKCVQGGCSDDNNNKTITTLTTTTTTWGAKSSMINIYTL